jgi:hypothetical protein
MQLIGSREFRSVSRRSGMSTGSSDSDRGRFALINAIAQILLALAAIGTIIFNYLSLRSEQATRQRVILQELLPSVRPVAKSADTYELEVGALNAGDKVARGCGAFFQDVNDELMPHRFLPGYVESDPGWSIAPGEKHTSKGKVQLKVSDFERDQIYVELWVKCVTDGARTLGYFYKVDLRNHTTEYLERWRDDPDPEGGRPWPEILKGEHRQPCPDSKSRHCKLDPPPPA